MPEIVTGCASSALPLWLPSQPSDPADAKGEYGVEFVPLGHFTKLHELILAVPRRILAEGGWDKLFAALAPARCLSMTSRR